MISSMVLFYVEWQLGLRVLMLSPAISLVSGMVFLVKASLLDGRFYFQAAVLFVTAGVMTLIQSSNLPDVSVGFYGLVSGLSFFIPGLKYYRQRIRR
jgi:hypothetical protein